MGFARQCHGKVPKFIELEREIDDEIRATPPPATPTTPAPRGPRDELSSFIEDLEARYGIRMIRVKKGQYKVGDATKTIFVRLLRSHVVVRVGGGWDTLEHYLATHERANAVIGGALSSVSYADAASILRVHAVDEFHDPVQTRDAFGVAKRGRVSAAHVGPAKCDKTSDIKRAKRLSAGSSDATGGKGSAAVTVAGVATKPAASPGARQTPSSSAAGASSAGRKKSKKGSERRASVDTIGRRHPFLGHANGASPVGVTVGRSHPFLASPGTAVDPGRTTPGVTPETKVPSKPRRRVSVGGSGFSSLTPKSTPEPKPASAQSSPSVAGGASRRRSGTHGRGHPFLDSLVSQGSSPTQKRSTRQKSEEPKTARSQHRKERSRPWAEASPAGPLRADAAPEAPKAPALVTETEGANRDIVDGIDGSAPNDTANPRDAVVGHASAPSPPAPELAVRAAAAAPAVAPLHPRGAAEYTSGAREVWYQLRRGSVHVGDEDCVQLTARTLTVRNLKLGVCESRKGASKEGLHPADLTVFCDGTQMKPREKLTDLDAVYVVQLPPTRAAEVAVVSAPSTAPVEAPDVPAPTPAPMHAGVLDRLDWAAAPEVAPAADDAEIAALLRKIEIAEDEARRLAVPSPKPSAGPARIPGPATSLRATSTASKHSDAIARAKARRAAAAADGGAGAKQPERSAVRFPDDLYSDDSDSDSGSIVSAGCSPTCPIDRKASVKQGTPPPESPPPPMLPSPPAVAVAVARKPGEVAALEDEAPPSAPVWSPTAPRPHAVSQLERLRLNKKNSPVLPRRSPPEAQPVGDQTADSAPGAGLSQLDRLRALKAMRLSSA